MAKKIVTLYIDDTSIRLLVTHGKREKKWATILLEPGLVKNAVIIKEAEVAAKIKQVLKDYKVRTKKVIVGISGLHCMTRPVTLPQLPKEMLAEAVMREAKRILPVPLEELYILWQPIPAPEGQIQVFLVAVPREVADALVKMLHRVGLKLHLMDIKPLVLARLVKKATAIIVDVQPTEFDIVIMSDGIPQPVRTIPLPSEALSWQEKLSTISNDINRTIEFYNSNNPEKTLSSTVPIFASGQLADEADLCQSLSDELGYPVLSLLSPLECSQRLASSHYMVNIGLVLKKLSSEKEVGPSVANVNVLPIPYRPEPISIIRIFALSGAVIAIALLAFQVMYIKSTSAEIALASGQLNTANQFLQQEMSLKQELIKNVAAAEEPRINLATALTSLRKQRQGVSGDLEVTINSLPRAISLSSINHSKNTLIINGRSPSEKEVLSYLRNLDASGRFSEITITSMTRIEGEGMHFAVALRAGEHN